MKILRSSKAKTQVEFLSKKRMGGGAIESGEPLSMAASVSSTVICCQRLDFGSIIPVFAFSTFSTTGEDECSNNKCYDH